MAKTKHMEIPHKKAVIVIPTETIEDFISSLVFHEGIGDILRIRYNHETGDLRMDNFNLLDDYDG
jgi:hypothetical protein